MPLFQTPAHDLRIIWRAYAKPEGRAYLRGVLIWLTVAGGLFTLSLLGWGRFTFGLLFRVWLFGGSAYWLGKSAKIKPKHGDERVSTVGVLIILVVVLGCLMVIGGSILIMFGEE